jgi:hypothetical protein
MDITSPVVGQTNITGLTNPTYTLTEVNAPVPNAQRFIVSALGGTQTGVEVHTANNPFMVTLYSPSSYQAQGDLNAQGLPRSVPRNNYSTVITKGVEVFPDMIRTNTIKVINEVPAGAETNDPESLAAAWACAAAICHVNAEKYRLAILAGNL